MSLHWLESQVTNRFPISWCVSWVNHFQAGQSCVACEDNQSRPRSEPWNVLTVLPCCSRWHGGIVWNAEGSQACWSKSILFVHYINIFLTFLIFFQFFNSAYFIWFLNIMLLTSSYKNHLIRRVACSKGSNLFFWILFMLTCRCLHWLQSEHSICCAPILHRSLRRHYKTSWGLLWFIYLVINLQKQTHHFHLLIAFGSLSFRFWVPK